MGKRLDNLSLQQLKASMLSSPRRRKRNNFVWLVLYSPAYLPLPMVQGKTLRMAKLAKGLAGEGKSSAVLVLAALVQRIPAVYKYCTIILQLSPDCHLSPHKKTCENKEHLSYHSTKWSSSRSALCLFYQLVL